METDSKIFGFDEMIVHIARYRCTKYIMLSNVSILFRIKIRSNEVMSPYVFVVMSSGFHLSLNHIILCPDTRSTKVKIILSFKEFLKSKEFHIDLTQTPGKCSQIQKINNAVSLFLSSKTRLTKMQL